MSQLPIPIYFLLSILLLTIDKRYRCILMMQTHRHMDTYVLKHMIHQRTFCAMFLFLLMWFYTSSNMHQIILFDKFHVHIYEVNGYVEEHILNMSVNFCLHFLFSGKRSIEITCRTFFYSMIIIFHHIYGR